MIAGLGFGKINGSGLFMGLELPDGKAEQVVRAAKEQGIIFGRSGNKVLMRPPLVITESDLDQVAEVMSSHSILE